MLRSSTQLTDRIYWEFNNRNLIIPFTGMPFVTKSSQVKHCQHGSQYYKLKAERLSVSGTFVLLLTKIFLTLNSFIHKIFYDGLSVRKSNKLFLIYCRVE